jgi:hypothetical protein
MHCIGTYTSGRLQKTTVMLIDGNVVIYMIIVCTVSYDIKPLVSRSRHLRPLPRPQLHVQVVVLLIESPA